MTSCESLDARAILSGGVRGRSPVGLYLPASPRTIVLLSLYGTPQQTRALAARLAQGQSLSVVAPDGAVIDVARPERMRIRGRSVAYGKHHILVWDETVPDTCAIWMHPEQKADRLRRALSRYKIPYDPAWLQEIEQMLLKQEQMVPLGSWGPAGGYWLNIKEDDVCSWLVTRFGAKSAATRPSRRRPRVHAA